MYVDEAITPRIAGCPNCGGTGYYVNGSHTVWGAVCPENPTQARHGTTYKGVLMYCDSCSLFLGAVKTQSSALSFCDNYQSGPCFRPYYLWNNA